MCEPAFSIEDAWGESGEGLEPLLDVELNEEAMTLVSLPNRPRVLDLSLPELSLSELCIGLFESSKLPMADSVATDRVGSSTRPLSEARGLVARFCRGAHTNKQPLVYRRVDNLIPPGLNLNQGLVY